MTSHFELSINWFLGSGFILAILAMPNKSVKGTRRPLAVLEGWFLIKVRWLRLAFASGAPLTVTLDKTTNTNETV